MSQRPREGRTNERRRRARRALLSRVRGARGQLAGRRPEAAKGAQSAGATRHPTVFAAGPGPVTTRRLTAASSPPSRREAPPRSRRPKAANGAQSAGATRHPTVFAAAPGPVTTRRLTAASSPPTRKKPSSACRPRGPGIAERPACWPSKRGGRAEAVYAGGDEDGEDLRGAGGQGGGGAGEGGRARAGGTPTLPFTSTAPPEPPSRGRSPPAPRRNPGRCSPSCRNCRGSRAG